MSILRVVPLVKWRNKEKSQEKQKQKVTNPMGDEEIGKAFQKRWYVSQVLMGEIWEVLRNIPMKENNMQRQRGKK